VRVAALYDIHGMADALDAVLAELEGERFDAIVVGGDVAGGPQPVEVLDRLRGLEGEVFWVRGNGDRALGPDGARAVMAGEEGAAALEFTAGRLADDDRAFLSGLPERVTLEVDGLGPVLFCHGTPRSDLEIVTAATPDEFLRRALAGVGAHVVVTGHTHMQLDREVDGVRWVNAGSVGMPYEGEVAAFWALLGPDVEFRRTPFDTERAAEAILGSGWPEAGSFVAENVRAAVSPDEVIPLFERIAADRGER
jgi:putative phosphoesterase